MLMRRKRVKSEERVQQSSCRITKEGARGGGKKERKEKNGGLVKRQFIERVFFAGE